LKVRPLRSGTEYGRVNHRVEGQSDREEGGVDCANGKDFRIEIHVTEFVAGVGRGRET